MKPLLALPLIIVVLVPLMLLYAACNGVEWLACKAKIAIGRALDWWCELIVDLEDDGNGC